MNISNRVTQLSPDKRRLLSLLMKEKSMDQGLLPLVGQPRSGNLAPASFSQRRLWFLDQLTPNESTFIIPGAYRFKGKLDLEAFRRTVVEIVRRHEILRTTFVTVNDEPMQLITEPQELLTLLIDISHLPPGERNIEAKRIKEEEATHNFDLERGPLLRIVLLKFADSEYIVLSTMHHIISDGWSMGVLINELSTIYNAYLHGEAHALPELPIQFADFAIWQNEQLQGETIERQLDYWKNQLRGAPPLMDLPTDRSRPAVRTNHGGNHAIALTPEITSALRQLCRQEEVTMFMLLLAVYKVLLYRYTAQSHIVIGSSVAGRSRKELEGLIGFFVNSLVLHTELSDMMNFRQVLRRVREGTLGAYDHQDLPFERLVEEFRLDRNLSYTPLFQVYFSLENPPHSKKELTGIKIDSLGESPLISQYDLSLNFYDAQDRIVGYLEYSIDLFDHSTIEQLMRHYEQLLRSIIKNADQYVSQLSLLTKEEEQAIRNEYNRSSVDLDVSTRCLNELFEEQVEKCPDSVALMYEDQQLSYHELNSKSNQLAHYLHSFGVRPEQRVAICLERRLEMVVSLLGVLKSGGAYVPLDPSYPSDRIAWMLEDSAAIILLTNGISQSPPPALSSRITIVNMDNDEWRWAELSRSNPERTVTGINAGNPAYIIYTSGSTGKPKGVVIAHRNTTTFLHWGLKAFSKEQLAFVAGTTSICFDVSVFEIFSTLSCGGTVVLFENALSLINCNYLEHISHINIVPSAMIELISAGIKLSPKTSINLGGEPVSKELLQQLSMKTEVETLFNLYGPTEDTTYSTIASISLDQTTKPTIGVPVNNKQMHILRELSDPMPKGVAGEIYIGGMGVARGYLARPEITAERFLPNSFSQQPGERVYRTGDLGRWLSNGEIEFLGRNDHQVKIQGHRIELSEIESRLSEHAGVENTVVIAREDGDRDKRLIAYYTGDEIDVAQLRSHLSSSLPEYMLPAVYVHLETMPLTPNGKLDRQALPPPNYTKDKISEFNTPRDMLEMNLVNIFERILNIGPIGVRDNFFEFGGHSLLVVRLVSLIEKELGKRLPVAMIFQNATVEKLAVIFRKDLKSLPHSLLVPLQTMGAKSPLFFVHAVGGGAFNYLALSNRLGEDQPFYALQSKGLYDQRTPHISIKDMAADYIEHIKTIQSTGPYILGGWSMGAAVAFEMAQQLMAQEESIASLIMIDSFSPSVCRSIAYDDERSLFIEFAQDLGISTGRFNISQSEFLSFETNKQLAYLLNLAVEDGVIPPDIGLTDFQSMFNVYIMNLRALRNYKPNPIAVPILYFSAANEVKTEDPTNGWGNVASAGIKICEIPGDHYTSLREPHVDSLAKQLKFFLTSVRFN